MSTIQKPKLRWYQPTPGRLLVFLLVVEGILLLSERWGWFPFNQHKGYTVLIAVAIVGLFLPFMLLWFIVSIIFHWRFQFSIRSLLVLTIAVAIPCSWLAVEMKWAREQKEAVENINKLGGNVLYDYHLNSSGYLIQGAEPPGPAWLRKLVGDEFLISVNSVDLCGVRRADVDLEHLERLNQLKQIELWGAPITDAGLKHIKGLKQLKRLGLNYTHVTGAGLENLKEMKQLEELMLYKTQITDAGLEDLKELKQLQTLGLDDTQITDTGLEHLKGLNQLQLLSLSETKVTDAGVAELQKALPNCKIEH